MTKVGTRRALRSRSVQAGRTLVELMISLVIGLVIVGAIMAIYLSTAGTSKQSNAVTRMSEDAAIAIAAAAAAARGANFNMLWPPAMSGFIRLVADDGGVFNHLAAK